MTVPSMLSKISYVGDGTTNNWSIPFNINGVESSEIEVYLTNISTGVSTLVESDFSVDLNVPEVVYPITASPITSDYMVVINRRLALTQNTDYKNQGPIPAETIEESTDRVVMMIQQLQEQLDRTIQADISQEEATLDEITAAASTSATEAAASAAAAASDAASAISSAEAALTAQAAAEAARDEAVSLAGFEAASQAEAEAATNNTKFMTPLRVKQEVEKEGAVMIPAANLPTTDTFFTGFIGMYSGLIANIPAGWYFCNGENGTPDLRNRMIVCGDVDDGGVVKTSVMGSPLQTGGEAYHTMTEPELVPHDHPVSVSRSTASSGSGSTIISGGSTSTGETGGGVPFPVMNPFYALAFIMKG